MPISSISRTMPFAKSFGQAFPHASSFRQSYRSIPQNSSTTWVYCITPARRMHFCRNVGVVSGKTQK